jgi:thiaminase/transcriptional activator TenA
VRFPGLENLLIDLYTGFRLTHRSCLLTQSQVFPVVTQVGGTPDALQKPTATRQPASTTPAAAKAHDLQTIGVFARLLDETLNTEMQLHRDYCQRLGIAKSDLEATAPASITHAYTRHLLTVAYSGSIAEIVAAVLPCQLGYAEIGTALACEDRSGANSTYAEWIRTYSSPEFIAGAEKLGRLLDDLTTGWPPRERAPLETHFLTSSRYEYLFWEMSWTQSFWPV